MTSITKTLNELKELRSEIISISTDNRLTTEQKRDIIFKSYEIGKLLSRSCIITGNIPNSSDSAEIILLINQIDDKINYLQDYQ